MLDLDCMASTPKTRPPMSGVFVYRDVAEEHLGRPARAARPVGVERPLSAPRVATDSPFEVNSAAVVSREPTGVVHGNDLTPLDRPRGGAERVLPASPPKRADPRSADGFASSTEVAFGSVAVKRGPPTIPAKPNEPGAIAAAKANRIIEELGRCGPGAEAPFLEPLRALGQPGLDALRRDFPGLLWFDRNLPHQREPRGRDLSPIASLFHSFGRASIPYVIDRMGADDADLRYYATLLALDIGDPSFLDAIALRLFDEDTQIASHAMRGLERIGGPARIERLGDELAAVLLTPGAYRRQSRAIELLSALRHPRALEALVATLEVGESTLMMASRVALQKLTAHDLGSRAKDWAKFVKSRRSDPRTSWLLDGLVGKEVALRDRAAQELAVLTGQSADYVPGCALGDAKASRKVYERAIKR